MLTVISHYFTYEECDACYEKQGVLTLLNEDFHNIKHSFLHRSHDVDVRRHTTARFLVHLRRIHLQLSCQLNRLRGPMEKLQVGVELASVETPELTSFPNIQSERAKNK